MAIIPMSSCLTTVITATHLKLLLGSNLTSNRQNTPNVVHWFKPKQDTPETNYLILVANYLISKNAFSLATRKIETTKNKINNALLDYTPFS